METKVRDLAGQRSMTIDARENTVFIDADDYCYEIDKGMLVKALRKELGAELACLECTTEMVAVA